MTKRRCDKILTLCQFRQLLKMSKEYCRLTWNIFPLYLIRISILNHSEPDHSSALNICIKRRQLRIFRQNHSSISVSSGPQMRTKDFTEVIILRKQIA